MRPDWRSRGNDIFDEEGDLIATTLTVPKTVTALGRELSEKHADERARMIVRAVNSNAALVAALVQALPWLAHNAAAPDASQIYDQACIAIADWVK